jgi:alpha-tubulin suppressor-like RCC1 family protein
MKSRHRIFFVLSFGISACPRPEIEPNAVQVASGQSHSCALFDDGSLKCWGLNNVGQLGTGDTNDITTPSSGKSVALGGKATQIEVSADFSCALLDTGNVRCWGQNRVGQLGYGNTNTIGDDETPASAGDIDLGGEATQIALGSTHACALLDTGNVRCWGFGGGGGLGYGNPNNIGDDEVPASAGDIELGQPAVQITAGGDSTCALFEDGGVKCWGTRATLGQGDPSLSSIGDNETPIALPNISLGAAAIQIDASDRHVCAVLGGGGVRCWGLGADGELGVEGVSSLGINEPPSDVAGIDLGANAIRVEAGGAHTCALLDTNDVKCWGSAERGALGLGNDDSIGLDAAPSSASIINLGKKVSQLSAGGDHNCAVTEDAAIHCWGSNDFGQLGIGATNHIGDDETPSALGAISIEGNVSQVVAGWAYSCVILDTGAVQCWGDNSSGQNGLGLGEDVGDNELPSAAGDLPLGGNAVQISTRDFQACALLDTGGVRCWGKNLSGVLGYGDIGIVGDDETPAAMGDLDLGAAATQVALGGSHACAIMEDGGVRCWGDNSFGFLGYGNTEFIGDDEAPGAGGDIDLGGIPSQLVAGIEFTCALLDAGNVRCWGNSLNGQLGYGNVDTIGDDETPASAGDVDLGGAAIQLVAGDTHSCVILTGGNVRCWGDSSFGKLGYGAAGNVGDDETPASVGDVNVGGNVVQLTAHELTTCALLDTGAVRCWGFNLFGMLGYGISDAFISDDVTPAELGDIELGGVAVQISAGVFHTCALLDTGAVKCWGINTDGEIGIGSDSDVGDSEPVGNNPVKL